MLELMQSYFGLNHRQMSNQINGLFQHLLDVLTSKQIEYYKLKSVLVPNTDKNEVVFIFDRTKIESPWYGFDIFEKVIPLFNKQSSHSILYGDYMGDDKLQDKLRLEFFREIEPIRHTNYKHSNQYFCVYINNLSDKMVATFKTNLFSYEPYIGSIDLNYSSFMKTYLSHILCPAFIKYKNNIIMGHEDDCDNNENINILGYPFEQFGYNCKSLQDSMYGLFLSYKIEHAVFEGFEIDTAFSINAITPKVFSLTDFDILIEDTKLQYLISGKRGKLKKAGFLKIDKNEIEKLIKEKINSNYIYNLTFLNEYNTLKFNIQVELKAGDTGNPVKITLSLEYNPEEKLLRLITLY